MSKKTQLESQLEIDEAWLMDWVGYGYKECEAFLLKHLAFERYYERRENGQA